MSGIDVFVGNYPLIDWQLYDLWVEGNTEREALTELKDRLVTGGSGAGVQFEMMLSDLHDNYRLFQLWETMLHQPIMFR